MKKDYLFRLAWGTDAGFYRLVPEEVLHPATEAQVQAIMRRARKERRHITFRAAGTSLSGQAVSDSLLVVCGKKWESCEVLEEGRAVRLQPGVIGQRVNEVLRPYGRRFTPDPASIRSAMVGGIVSNNASGMCCGTHANSYRMLRSVRIILPDGTLLDTGDAASREAFRRSHPDFIRRIEQLRDRTLADVQLTNLIRRKYSIKNVTGLTILPFVEYTDPFDIIARLIPGSEGTLAFLSEITMNTGEDYRHTASALLLFPTTDSACRAVTQMKHTGLPAAAEYFDRKAMQVVEADFPELQGLPADAGAVLVKLEASTADQLRQKQERIEQLLASYELLNTQLFTQDPQLVAKYWAMRAGIFPAVGGTRPVGTTCLIEDIAFPIDFLAEATADLQALFKEHNYPDAVIYGHALEGNYHFILNQRFDTPQAVEQYDRMMHAVVSLVVDKYHGSLKAEHGTGRNMAPFVRREWGDSAYRLMLDVKQLFDPLGIMNPGVIFNEDPQSYLQHLKPLPEVHPLIDRCIECGFCEVNCVSCGFTRGNRTIALSSRQRIVLQREIARLEAAGQSKEAAVLRKAFRRAGADLCAGDGLCSTSCPVGINTGEYIHLVREQAMSPLGKRVGLYAGRHFAAVGSALKSVLSLAGFAQDVLGNRLMSVVGKGLHLCGIPLWTPAMPRRVKTAMVSQHVETHDHASLNSTEEQSAQVSRPSASKVVYFPSCLNQRLGLQKGSPASQPTMGDMVELLEKAGYEVVFPENMQNLCCGTIWESKGMPGEADRKAAELHEALRKASDNYKWPVVCDQSPCLYRIRHTAGSRNVKIFEPAEFISKYVLDHLSITPLDETVMLHVTCSMRKMGLGDTLLQVAQRCAKRVVVPDEVGCCAFAGDKGFTDPELNAWALRKLKPQVEKTGATVGISNSRTCEIGLSHHSGIPYMNIVWLVNKASTPKTDMSRQ